MKRWIAGLAVLVAVVVATPAAPAQANGGTCQFDDSSFAWSETPNLAKFCLIYNGWWYNGSGLRLVKTLSPDAVRMQMTKGLQARVDVDWDPRHKSGSICCWVPAGYKVTILP